MDVVTDFCQWGVPWRKRTTLRLWCVQSPELLAKRCIGCGRCSRTGQPHVQLVGVAQCGRFWTSVAEPYPKPLCRRLAAALTNSYEALRMHRKWQISFN